MDTESPCFAMQRGQRSKMRYEARSRTDSPHLGQVMKGMPATRSMPVTRDRSSAPAITATRSTSDGWAGRALGDRLHVVVAE